MPRSIKRHPNEQKKNVLLICHQTPWGAPNWWKTWFFPFLSYFGRFGEFLSVLTYLTLFLAGLKNIKNRQGQFDPPCTYMYQVPRLHVECTCNICLYMRDIILKIFHQQLKLFIHIRRKKLIRTKRNLSKIMKNYIFRFFYFYVFFYPWRFWRVFIWSSCGSPDI